MRFTILDDDGILPDGGRQSDNGGGAEGVSDHSAAYQSGRYDDALQYAPNEGGIAHWCHFTPASFVNPDRVLLGVRNAGGGGHCLYFGQNNNGTR